MNCDPSSVYRAKFCWRSRAKVQNAVPKQQIRESDRWRDVGQVVHFINFEAEGRVNFS